MAPPEVKKVSLPDYFKTGYILIVDDMSNMRKTIKNMLRQVGITATMEADDGDTMLSVLRRTPGCRFILMDWNMPRMPGIDAVKETRSEFSGQDLPILMVTAEIERDQITQATEMGVNGYIIKPFVAKTLEEKIQNILDNRLNPPEYVKLLKAGEEYAKRGMYQEAVALLDKARVIKDSARVNVHIGEVMEMMGKTEKAHVAYDTAAKQNPQYLKAHTKTAELHMKQGNEDAALEAMKKAAEISPSNADRHVNIGKIYLKKGDDSKAQEFFAAAIKHDPVKSSEIAEEMLKAGKADQAEKYFRQSLEKHTDTVHLYNRLGIALRRQGKWREAILEYENAIKVDPLDEGLYFNMAKAYLEGSDFESARRNFERALQINPDLQPARNEIAALEKRAQA